jgi:hypothetical protein
VPYLLDTDFGLNYHNTTKPRDWRIVILVVKILFGLACLGVFWNVATSIMIFNELKKRGIKVSFIWLRIKAPVYAYQYKEMTKTESGQVGALFYHWLVSIIFTLVLGLAVVIILIVK